MDYKLKLDQIIGLILNAVENEQSVNLILENNIAYDVSKELLYVLDANFEYQDGNDFDKLLEENEILSLCMIFSEDGDVRYMLQPACNNDGMTYPDEDSEIIYIQDSLYDCIDEDVFDGQIAILVDSEEEFNRIIEALKDDDECNGDCCNCSLQNDDEDYEKEIEEDAIEVLLGELLDTLSEIKQSDIKGFNITLRNKITEAYEMGLDEGYENAVEEIKETLDNMIY